MMASRLIGVTRRRSMTPESSRAIRLNPAKPTPKIAISIISPGVKML